MTRRSLTLLPSHSFTPVPTGRLQRQCAACGQRADADRNCPKCEQQSTLQRQSAHQTMPASVPSVVQDVLNSSGQPLETRSRELMEARFEHDFSNVRVHTDTKAAASANAVNALAYTVGHHVVFGSNQYNARTAAGQRLLAHELTHTIQQGKLAQNTQPILGISQPNEASEREADEISTHITATPLSSQNAAAHPKLARVKQTIGRLIQREAEGGSKEHATTPAASTDKGSVWETGKICDRESRRNIDFPNTYIKMINIDVGNLTGGMTLNWHNPGSLALPTGPFAISPGAGRCCRDCNDVKASQEDGSLCTPKGTSDVYNTQRCSLSTSWARNPTYFDQSRNGIAIHSGPSGNMPPKPGYPASHGCVRTTVEGSRIVHDNSKVTKDATTQVSVSGTWSSSRCYINAKAKQPDLRSEKCKPKSDPKKSDSQKKADTDTSSSEQEVALSFMPEWLSAIALALVEQPEDGAGPA